MRMLNTYKKREAGDAQVKWFQEFPNICIYKYIKTYISQICKNN